MSLESAGTVTASLFGPVSPGEGRAVFAPTDTQDWDRCPVYRKLNREEWRPRDQVWTPNLLLGIAIGDGLSEAYRHWSDPNPESFGRPVAFKALEDGYVENPEDTLPGLVRLVGRGLEAAIKEDAPRGRAIVRVDVSLGVCRPDLIVRGPSGLSTINTKVSRQVRPDYRGVRLAEYETSGQLWHEAWEAQQFFGEPVVSRGVLQVVLSPRLGATLMEWPVTSEGMAFWLSEAEATWALMDQERRGERPVTPRHASCHGKFGRCVFLDACHEFRLDPERMAAYYTKEGV